MTTVYWLIGAADAVMLLVVLWLTYRGEAKLV